MIDNKTIRDHIILKKMFPGSSEPSYETRTASGAIASFNTNYVAPLESCVLTLNPLQTGTGDPSPTNPRPITGFSGVTVHVADGESPHVVDNTYPIALGRTVYGGSLNVTSGEFESDLEKKALSELTFVFQSNYNRFESKTAIDDIKTPPNNNTKIKGLCSCFVIDTSNNTSYLNDNTIGVSTNGKVQIRATSLQGDLTALSALLSGQELIYELATPTEVQLTPQEVRTLLGSNNIYHDANGETAVSYLYQTGEGGGIDKKTFLPFFYPIRKGDI